jgi:hypothetical protein
MYVWLLLPKGYKVPDPVTNQQRAILLRSWLLFQKDARNNDVQGNNINTESMSSIPNLFHCDLSVER